VEQLKRQAFHKNSWWQRRRYVVGRSVRQTWCSDWKTSVADSWKAGTSDDKQW